MWFERSILHIAGAPRLLRRSINPPLNARGLSEVPAQMRNMFKKQYVMPKSYMVKQHKVLVYLPHIADVRHNRKPVLSREQTHSDELGDSRQSRAVRLYEIDCPRLNEVLEQDPIRDVFPKSDPAGNYLSRKSSVSFEIIGMRRLLYPQRIDTFQRFAHPHRLHRVPLLIGIKH
jgi:hypothetical protein